MHTRRHRAMRKNGSHARGEVHRAPVDDLGRNLSELRPQRYRRLQPSTQQQHATRTAIAARAACFPLPGDVPAVCFVLPGEHDDVDCLLLPGDELGMPKWGWGEGIPWQRPCKRIVQSTAASRSPSPCPRKMAQRNKASTSGGPTTNPALINEAGHSGAKASMMDPSCCFSRAPMLPAPIAMRQPQQKDSAAAVECDFVTPSATTGCHQTVNRSGEDEMAQAVSSGMTCRAILASSHREFEERQEDVNWNAADKNEDDIECECAPMCCEKGVDMLPEIAAAGSGDRREGVENMTGLSCVKGAELCA